MCGTPETQASAHELVERLAADEDPNAAANARWCLATPISAWEAHELVGEAR